MSKKKDDEVRGPEEAKELPAEDGLPAQAGLPDLPPAKPVRPAPPPPPPPPPPASPSPQVTGELYSAQPGMIMLAGRGSTQGHSNLTGHPTADSVSVTINGREYDGLHELRRGDHVTLIGDPVATVQARR